MLFHWQICCTVTPKRIAMPHGDTEADRDAGEDVAADDRVNDVLAIVHIGALRILLPGAVAAGDFIEFFFVESHFSFLLFNKFVFFLLLQAYSSTASVTQVSQTAGSLLTVVFCFPTCRDHCNRPCPTNVQQKI